MSTCNGPDCVHPSHESGKPAHLWPYHGLSPRRVEMTIETFRVDVRNKRAEYDTARSIRDAAARRYEVARKEHLELQGLVSDMGTPMPWHRKRRKLLISLRESAAACKCYVDAMASELSTAQRDLDLAQSRYAVALAAGGIAAR